MLVRIFCILVCLGLVACKTPEPNDLHGAARMGSLPRIEKALELGVNVNQMSTDGRTPLHEAVGRAHPDAVRLLLEKGADPNLAGNDGKTPWQLLWEQKKGFLHSNEAECAIVLLEAGFKPGTPQEGGTFLHESARQVNNGRLIKLLVESGIEVDARDENGWTALHFAANESHAEAAQALLNADADANAETTKTWEKTRPKNDETSITVFRYEKGSRPLDVARYQGGARSGKSVQAMLEEWGGTKNPEVKNIRER